jgi:hypothetical protein
MYLQDGKPLTQEEHELLGRDAEGRFFDQSFRLAMPGHPEAHSDMIVDPIAHRLVAWRSGTHKAVGDPLPPATHLDVAALAPDRRMQEAQFPKGKSNVTTENLGMKTIGGVLATGTRTVTVLPTGAAGNSQPLESSQEIWVANDLQIVVSETDTSPFSGTRKVEMLSLERTAPPANRFEVPSDMTVVM